MKPALPQAFLDRPIAHRALHDTGTGRPENSLAAIRAAIAEGFGIEIDVQMSSDGMAMVFHDYVLDRLTGETGPVRQRNWEELVSIRLVSADEGIPTLPGVLEEVRGLVPLLIEIKDQDGALGPNVGLLEEAVARDLRDYKGPVAVMSFNPHSVARMAHLAPDVPRGLTTDPFHADVWPVPEARLVELRSVPDFDRVGASFISHNARDLDAAPVLAMAEKGVPILCWTIRSAEEEAAARRIANNVTFEGYLPA